MSDPSPALDSSDADDEALEYRSLEPLAIVAVLLGLASPVAIFQPLLAVVPILGLLVLPLGAAWLMGDKLSEDSSNIRYYSESSSQALEK